MFDDGAVIALQGCIERARRMFRWSMWSSFVVRAFPFLQKVEMDFLCRFVPFVSFFVVVTLLAVGTPLLAEAAGNVSSVFCLERKPYY